MGHGLCLLLLLGCGAAADHERLGDRNFRDNKWAEAQAEYEAAARGKFSPGLWAKLGEAARRAGISGSTMKSRVQRARAQLRDAVAACCAVHTDRTGRVHDYETPAGCSCN